MMFSIADKWLVAGVHLLHCVSLFAQQTRHAIVDTQTHRQLPPQCELDWSGGACSRSSRHVTKSVAGKPVNILGPGPSYKQHQPWKNKPRGICWVSFPNPHALESGLVEGSPWKPNGSHLPPHFLCEAGNLFSYDPSWFFSWLRKFSIFNILRPFLWFVFHKNSRSWLSLRQLLGAPLSRVWLRSLKRRSDTPILSKLHPVLLFSREMWDFEFCQIV